MSFVSPINAITLDCSGNVLPNAILLADVDSNKSNELLVGTQEGELLIFKALRNHTDAQLWRKAHGLGFITAIIVGPIITNSNESQPVICVANTEGAIHLFLLRSNTQKSRVRSAGGGMNSGNRNDSRIQLHGTTTLASGDDDQQQQIQAVFSQQLICNPRVLLIQDYNENEKQLIISYCDRTIRVFTSIIIEDFEGRLTGRFVLKHVFNIADQIHTLSSKRLSTKDYELVVPQPGGNLLRFNPNEENGRIFATEKCCEPVLTGWTEAIAVDKFLDEPVYATICHDDMNIYSSSLNTTINSIKLSDKTGYLCGLRKGSVTKDNYNQLVAISSVDGDTFIIDRNYNVTRFRPPLSSNTGCAGGNDSISHTNFYDQIQAFTSGLFGDNMFCFIYVLTHNDKIIIVHSIEISNTKTTNLLTTLTKPPSDEKLVEVGSAPEKLKELLHPHY